jgi:hypothetical protein
MGAASDASVRSDPVWVRDKTVGLAKEHLGWQIAAFLAAQAALNDDGLERKLFRT